MENATFTSELEKIAENHGVRLWIAERFGRRWSYMAGGGEERFLPPSMIAEIDGYGVFVEGEISDGEVIVSDVRGLLSRFFDVRQGE